MLIGLNTYSHHLAFGRHGDLRPSRPMDLFAFLDRVSEYGLQGFHIDPAHLRQADDEHLDVLREESSERGLFVEYGINGVDAVSIKKGVQICRRLGSPILRTSFGFSRFAETTDLARELEHAERSIRSCVRMLEDTDVRLALENRGDVRSDELVALVETLGSTHVGICLDVGNSLRVLEDVLDAAERMIPFAVAVQFKDYTVTDTATGCKFTGVPLGMGVLPLEELFRIVEEQGVADRLILEIPTDPVRGERSSLEREESAIRESIEFCRSVLGIGAPEKSL